MSTRTSSLMAAAGVVIMGVYSKSATDLANDYYS